jgi:hypothetical protein
MPAPSTTMSMEQRILRYRELKEQIDALEAEKKQISEAFKAGLAAFGVEVMQVPVGNDTFQLKLASRATHSCQWEMFKNLHPEIYAELVVDSSTNYVDVRKVGGARNARGSAEE